MVFYVSLILIRMPIPIMFDWGETEVSLWFTFRVPNGNSHNTDTVISRNYIRVHKAPHFFEADLFDDVDIRHSKNMIRFEAGQLFIALMKSDNAHYLWKTFKLLPGQKYGPSSCLKPSLTAIQLRDRRVASEKDMKEWQLEKLNKEKTLKIEMNKTAQDELWAAEKEKREKLALDKSTEKDEAAKAIYDLLKEEQAPIVKESLIEPPTVKSTEFIPLKSKYEPDDKADEDLDSDDDQEFSDEQKRIKAQKRVEELTSRKEAEERRVAERKAERLAKQKAEEDEKRALTEIMARTGGKVELAPMNAKRQERIQKKNFDTLPPIRDMSDMAEANDNILLSVKDLKLTADPNSILAQDNAVTPGGTTIKISMTKKIFPNVPLREQHLTMMQPKPRATPAVNGAASNDDEDPIWLKDTADKFARLGDFPAAVEAYSAALQEVERSQGARCDELWCARLLCSRAECFAHLKLLPEAKKDLGIALYKLRIAADARNDQQVHDQNNEKILSTQSTSAFNRPVMDITMHRLWSNIMARQAHINLLTNDYATAEKCLEGALEIPESIADDIKNSLNLTLKKVRDSMKEQNLVKVSSNIEDASHIPLQTPTTICN